MRILELDYQKKAKKIVSPTHNLKYSQKSQFCDQIRILCKKINLKMTPSCPTTKLRTLKCRCLTTCSIVKSFSTHTEDSLKNYSRSTLMFEHFQRTSSIKFVIVVAVLTALEVGVQNMNFFSN